MESSEHFDFENHARHSKAEYSKLRSRYESLADAIKLIIHNALSHDGLLIHSIESRAKDLASFEKKCKKRKDSNPSAPKYPDPLKEITDLSGVRIIVFFLKSIEEIELILKREFDIFERIDKSNILQAEEKFGYQSVHYLVKLKSNRAQLPEYSLCEDLVCEIQVRTILQHAWAEIEHDIQYKSVATIPSSIKRRFMALAGMLEVADREFQAIQKEDKKLRDSARQSLEEGEVNGIEITTDALKAYLDKKLGRDGRMSEYNYEFTSKLLITLGFKSFDQVEECIKHYDADCLSRAIYGNRQGQITRFEIQLLAGMGERYIQEHLWHDSEWFVDMNEDHLAVLKKQKIEIRNYNPLL